MSNIEQARKALIARVLNGNGNATTAERRAAFNREGLAQPLNELVDKVATQAHAISDADISAVRETGRSEDQIFEIVVCAAIGAASRQYETALAALKSAAKDRS